MHDNIIIGTSSGGINYYKEGGVVISVKNRGSNLPELYELFQNYPNPFNSNTTIEFEIPQREKVLIEVFNLLGQRVNTLLDTEMERGRHKIDFNAGGLSSGVYFYTLRSGSFVETRKMLLIR